MNYFLKANKNLLTYSFIILLAIPIFGVNFFLSFLGNILLLLFLIPLLLIILVFIGFNFYKSKINKCSNCGAISLGLSETCPNCGTDLEDIIQKNQLDKKPSERILLLTARFKVVKPIPIRKDPGRSGFKGTFLLGRRACNKRAIKEKPISGIAN